MSQTPTPQISGKMYLFEKPELLSKELHGKHGMGPPAKPFAFCAKVRAVPITISEFIAAGRHFPIIFSAEKSLVPLAVLGVIDDVNLFVTEEGRWEDHVYIPGYLRRYPFALANETGGERVAVVFDAAHEAITVGGEKPFFVDGQPSEDMQAAIEFCKQYEIDKIQTEQAMRMLETYNLIAPQTAQYGGNRDSEQKPFAQYFGVDEKRLTELPDDKFLELRRSGLLALIIAEMMSMGNWRTILERRARRFNLNVE
ncbi:MAG: SapC family protein, partial [Parvularculaceae bacterium]